MISPAVYDAGALLAAERQDRRFLVRHKTAAELHRELIVPTPVLTQAWRGGPRQATLAMALRDCRILPTTEATAKAAGVLLGRSRTADAVDAIVVAAALELDAAVVTSDPDDLIRLAAAVDAELTLMVV